MATRLHRMATTTRIVATVATGRECAMCKRLAVMLCAVLLIGVTSAWAEEIRGVVSYVDPATRTIHFTDGRVVQLKPGSTLTINGQPAVLESLRPGSSFVLMSPGPTTTTVTTVTQPVAPPPAVVSPPTPSPVSVTGTIARTDPLNQTITFQDGRIVQIAPTTMVWQQAPAISTLLPGAQVFVRDAMPVGYLPSGAAAPAPVGRYVMGTVLRVDPAAQQVMLTNGSVVRVVPTTTVRAGNNNAVTITQLHPGDEILVQVRQPATVAGPASVVTTTPVPAAADRYAGSALPYQGYADTRIEASDVLVLWSPQAR
jgi:hypothetical protein